MATLPSFCHKSHKKKTNIQPINLPGPPSWSPAEQNSHARFVSQQPGSGFGWMATSLYIQQDQNVTGSTWPCYRFYFEKHPLPNLLWPGEASAPPSARVVIRRRMDASGSCGSPRNKNLNMAVKWWQIYLYISDWSVQQLSQRFK